jgi:hypothetical protein
MQLVRLVLRVAGWLLTPLVAWAASHFGGGVGATIASGIPNPRLGLAMTILVAALSGLLGLQLWIRLLRRSPGLRHALHVAEDATPETDSLGDA